MKTFSRVLLGLSIIILGVLIGLNAIDLVNFSKFFNGWWTLFIIIPSISYLITSKDKAASIIFLLIGILLFLACRGLIDFSIVLKLILPVVLIGVGFHFIYSYYLHNKKDRDNNEIGSVFSSDNIKVTKKYNGGYINSIFGVLTFDLTEADISKDIVIENTSIFGKTKIILPKDVNVIVRNVNIFGKTTNNREKHSKKNTDTVFINTKNIFGGVDIL